MSWNDLSIREKADIIRDYVRKGTTSIMDIRNDYNSFAEGGSMDVDNSSVVQPEEQKKLTPPDWALRYMKKNGGELEPMAYPEVLPEVEVRPTQKDYDYLRWAKKIIPDAQSYMYDSPKRRRVQLFNGINDYYDPYHDFTPDDAIDRFVAAFELGNNPTISDTGFIGKIVQKYRSFQNQVDNYNPLSNKMNIYPLEASLSIKPGEEREISRTESLMHGIEEELPHAIQFQNSSIPKGESNYINRLIPGREHIEYDTPGKMEFNAHKIIQPLLESFLKGELGDADEAYRLIQYIPAYQKRALETGESPFANGGQMSTQKKYTDLLP